VPDRHHPADRAPDPGGGGLDELVQLAIDLGGGEDREAVQSEARVSIGTTVIIPPWPPSVASVRSRKTCEATGLNGG
jgi:hypothetical protein